MDIIDATIVDCAPHDHTSVWLSFRAGWAGGRWSSGQERRIEDAVATSFRMRAPLPNSVSMAAGERQRLVQIAQALSLDALETFSCVAMPAVNLAIPASGLHP